MVSTETLNQVSRIILRPNCSASWESNRRIIFGIGLANLIAASGMLSIGAWLVLPFMGLELFLLWYLLRRVFGKLQIQQVVSIEGNALTVEMGYFCAERRWLWPLADSRVLVTQHDHPWTPLEISLCHHGEAVRLGAFLNKEDCEKLLGILRQQGLMVRQFSGEALLKA
ncbi:MULTISPECIES: DUF2244 domain-containing protein [Spongiibacter]|uniref:DUF2244 domain-containing protein n=2 Tax=Spongiibacteraceae TaxID=1706375 RepID=UPI0023565028|nr:MULTISPECIES: DUF2244 domain-containing protein [Spongiibacter]